MIRHAAILLALGLAVVLQTSALPGLGAATTVYLPFVLLVLLGGRENAKSFFWYALWTGFLIDLFAGMPFGLFTAFVVFLANLHHMLFVRLFTNRSMYATWFLMAVMTVSGSLLLLATDGLFLLLGERLPENANLNQLPRMLAGNTVAVFLLALLVHAVGRRLGTAYLHRSSFRLH